MRGISLIKLIIFDLDGTLYIDGNPITGVAHTLAQLRQMGYALRFMTNTTTKNQKTLHQQLLDMGFDIQANELISAPEAARIQLRQIHQQKPISIWPVVSSEIMPDFIEFNINEINPDYIVLGDIGDAWSLALVNRLFNAMHAGAELISLHKNKFWQKDGGLHVDIGLFVAGLEYVTGKTAQIMGKPSQRFFQQVLDSAGAKPNQALLIGDDIDSDVGGAQNAGIKAILVKTGKYREAYTQASNVKPDMILSDVSGLLRYLNDVK